MAFLPDVGEIFSGCEILARIGQGAFGVVYLARNPLGQKVVIKIVTTGTNSSREMKGLRNYMTVAGTHPNLMRIFHIGEAEAGFYYVMEAADNLSPEKGYTPATLGNLFRSKKSFPPEEAIRITRDLLCGLKVMHRSGLVHRDIKPDNIIFVNGQVRLSDPGLVSRAGSTTSLAGTIGFIPPEVINDNAPMDQNADLYAVGKVFYCMVTGNKPGKYPQLPLEMRVEVCRQLYPVLSKMCNRDVGKRFKDADHFLAGLPEEITAPDWRDNFRNWRLNHHRLWGGILLTVILLVLLGLTGLAGIILQKRFHAARLEAARGEIAQLKDKLSPLTAMQLEVYAPEKLAEFRHLAGELEKSLAAGDPLSARETAGKLEILLTGCAGNLLPELPEKNSVASLFDGIQISGRIRGFLASPLANWLPEKDKQLFQDKLVQFEAAVFRGWGGLRPGMNYESMQEYYLPLVFMPPGVVKMPHNGKNVEISYPFWIGKHEILHENFTLSLGIAPQKSPHPQTPLERVAWNDMLFYCYVLTVRLKNAGVLPPGYIIRIPTEAEWQYAANNNWLGKDDLPLTESGVFNAAETAPAGSKKMSKCGLLDLYGNVAETVDPEADEKMQHAAVVLGGAFNESETLAFRRVANLKYQFIPYNIGYRLVAAPGNMDYFDRKFFLYGAVNVTLNGKVYELVGANSGAFTWQSADQLARLLGGKLAEFDSPQELEILQKKMPLLGMWPTFIGGRQVEGVWRWQSSGKPVSSTLWPVNAGMGDGTFLAFSNGYWRAVKDFKSAIFLCQWEEKEFPRRNEQLKSGKKLPGEVLRFSWKDRRFMLIDSSMLWYAAARYCELLGGRLAVLDDPDLCEFVREKSKAFPGSFILLGGYARRDKWFWLNGKEVTLPLSEDNRRPVASRNRNFVTLKNGEFYNSQFSHLLLCEWDENFDSAQLR